MNVSGHWSKLLNVGCRSPTKDRINLPLVLFSSWLRVRCGFSLAHMVAVHTSPYTRPTCQPEFACVFIPASTRRERKEGAPVSVCSSPFVAVGRWWLRARRLEAEIGEWKFRRYFHVFLTFLLRRSVRSWERREAEKELSWNKEWRSVERRSDVLRGWVSSEYRLTSDFSFSISHLEVCLSLPFGVRSERSEQESRAHGCHFWRSDFSFWFFVLFSAFGLIFFFPQEMPSCSLTDAGLCCWSSQDAGDPTTTRFLTLRQISVISPVWT